LIRINLSTIFSGDLSVILRLKELMNQVAYAIYL